MYTKEKETFYTISKKMAEFKSENYMSANTLRTSEKMFKDLLLLSLAYDSQWWFSYKTKVKDDEKRKMYFIGLEVEIVKEDIIEVCIKDRFY